MKHPARHLKSVANPAARRSFARLSFRGEAALLGTLLLRSSRYQ